MSRRVFTKEEVNRDIEAIKSNYVTNPIVLKQKAKINKLRKKLLSKLEIKSINKQIDNITKDNKEGTYSINIRNTEIPVVIGQIQW